MEDGKHHASVAGIVERVNKLICVKPLKTRYILCSNMYIYMYIFLLFKKIRLGISAESSVLQTIHMICLA